MNRSSLSFASFYGNEVLCLALRQLLPARLSHAILLTGPAGSGKAALGFRIAAALLCCEGGSSACGNCSSCLKMKAGQHPDFSLVDLGDALIPVSVSRALRSDAFTIPNEGGRKVYAIRHAHNMNAAAQNALLKILEEPPAYATFLLLTDQPERLLPTILSRVSAYSLSLLSPPEMQSALKEHLPTADDETRFALATQADGILGSALRLAADEEKPFAPLLSSIAKALASKNELSLFEALAPAAKLSRTELEHLFFDLAAAIQLAAGPPGAVAPPSGDFLRGIPLPTLFTLYDLSLMLAGRLSSHVNQTVLMGAACALYTKALRGTPLQEQTDSMGGFEFD